MRFGGTCANREIKEMEYRVNGVKDTYRRHLRTSRNFVSACLGMVILPASWQRGSVYTSASSPRLHLNCRLFGHGSGCGQTLGKEIDQCSGQIVKESSPQLIGFSAWIAHKSRVATDPFGLVMKSDLRVSIWRAKHAPATFPAFVHNSFVL